jgi:putative ABC transport system substrate-binding protein
MRRRTFLSGAAAVLAVPLRFRHAAAEQPEKLPVIGFLGSTAAGLFARYVAAFRQGLSETGYVEGQNVTIEYRWAEDHYDRLPELAADFVAREVDVITTNSMPAALAAKDATSTIPVVFETGIDPVEAGLVASYRPARRQPHRCLHAHRRADAQTPRVSFRTGSSGHHNRPTGEPHPFNGRANDR